ncbi:MAG TPA: LytTR family DNA-binding domain-containing protein [Puia sp.]
MLVKCIAIDDEPLALELIREYVGRFPKLQLVQTFDDGISGSEFLKNSKIDLLFIDINMPDINGIDLIRSLSNKPLIIFTTAHRKFAIEGFELEAVDYLLKPISYDRFEKAIQKVIEYSAYKSLGLHDDSGVLFVRSEYRLIKINISDIEYIESLEDYVKIHVGRDKYILTLMTLKGLLDKLPSNKFKRIHRSYIISLVHLRSILNRKAKLLSGLELPIGDSYSGFMNEHENL